jgi:hypothetical protein
MAQGNYETKRMKERIYSDIICKGFCNFFKEGKEEIQCGGYQLLIDNFTLNELEHFNRLIDRDEGIKKQIPLDDETLFGLVCSRCDFRIDGCDYREDRSGPPCGGFIFIEKLIKG